MTTYDWTKLDEGWRHEDGSLVHEIRHGDVIRYQHYSVQSGYICGYGSDPDAAFDFHKAAREQVAKCKVDWRAEVKGASERLGLAPLIYTDYACVRVVHGRLLSLRCTPARKFSWQIIGHSGTQLEPVPVGGDIEDLSKLASVLKEKGWVEE